MRELTMELDNDTEKDDILDWMNKTSTHKVEIPGPIAQRDDLSLSEKFLFGRIFGLCLAGKDWDCWVTNERLSEELDKSERTIQGYLDNLENEKDLIVRKWEKRQTKYGMKKVRVIRISKKIFDQ